jgi:hypothetical protein
MASINRLYSVCNTAIDIRETAKGNGEFLPSSKFPWKTLLPVIVIDSIAGLCSRSHSVVKVLRCTCA